MVHTSSSDAIAPKNTKPQHHQTERRQRPGLLSHEANIRFAVIVVADDRGEGEEENRDG